MHAMPTFAAFAVFFAMANCGLPGTSGFVGEFMVIMSAMQNNFWIALIAASSLIFGAAYSLWMVKRVFYGPPRNQKISALKDISWREFSILSILAVLIITVGVYPKIITDMTNATTVQFLEHMHLIKPVTSLPMDV
jgi:NADH-quinone oxidoreductase subunit M